MKYQAPCDLYGLLADLLNFSPERITIKINTNNRKRWEKCDEYTH